jgi:hypothetical protein
VRKIWFSLYTPQKGEQSDERLRPEDRARVVEEISGLHRREPKLMDMIPSVVEGYLRPPQNPDECIFAKTTACLSSDLKRTITPCQYGGDPDCTQCGCMASVGLEALGKYKLGGVVPLKTIFRSSIRVGSVVRGVRGTPPNGAHTGRANGHVGEPAGAAAGRE